MTVGDENTPAEFSELQTNTLSTNEEYASAVGSLSQAVTNVPDEGIVWFLNTDETVSSTIDGDKSKSIYAAKHDAQVVTLADNADTNILSYTSGNSSNFELRHFKLAGNGANNAANPVLLLDTSADEVLRDVWVDDSSGVGVLKRGGFGCVFDHCFIENGDDYGLKIDDTGKNSAHAASNGEIRNCKIEGGAGAIRSVNGNRWEVNGGKYSHDGTGTDHLIHITPGGWILRIREAIATGSGNHALKAENTIEVHGGVWKSDDRCIFIDGADDVSIVDGVEVAKCGEIGIFVNAPSAIVSDSAVTDGTRGIVIGGVGDNTVVEGCSVRSTTERGIQVSGDSCTISGCVVTNVQTLNGNEAVRIGGADCTVDGLTIEQDGGNTADGLLLAGAGCEATGVTVTGADISTGLDFGANNCRASGNFGSVNVQSGVSDARIEDPRLTWSDVTDSGTRTTLNGVGLNSGDPSSSGDWNGNGYEGVTVRDTTNSNTYIFNNGSWSQIASA